MMADQKKHVLVVEDEESLAYVVRRVFRSVSSRFEAKIVGTIQEALTACEASLPDLIVTDLLLPDGKGIEFCSTEFKDKKIPIIIMTGYEDEKYAIEAREKGAIDYIMKTESTLLELPRIADRALREWHYIEQVHEAFYQKGELAHELNLKKAELDNCISKICHELKEPIDAIKKTIRITGRNRLKIKKRKLSDDDWDTTTQSFKRIQRSLDELMEYDRYRTLEGKLESIDLKSIAKKAVKLLPCRHDRNEPEVYIADNLPTIKGQKEWILQLFIRLIDNAVKYSNDSIPVKISITFQQSNGESFMVIQDNGVGIHPKYHRRIFGLFEKLDADTEGLGVGLAICKRIVETHGGRLWVESKGVATGSQFCFTLQDDSDSINPENGKSTRLGKSDKESN